MKNIIHTSKFIFLVILSMTLSTSLRAQTGNESHIENSPQVDSEYPLGEPKTNPTFAPTEPATQPFQRFITYDLGGSSGTYNGDSYFEMQLGLNWFLKEWLIWRNSIFYRGSQNSPSFFGIDSNIRFQALLGDGDLSLRVFGGPGVRLTSEGNAIPLLEAGTVVRLGGLQVGGGARFIFHKIINSDSPNDVMFFLIFGGGGRL